ncbi:MAG TPA: pyridoxal phosphate-dependent aminotransferase [Polyangiaceae bacterium]|jgi:aspartate aminotransferase|nr:pyridoxal phosphate-dependent aminotransferase [Polyangiaceae bacterium]
MNSRALEMKARGVDVFAFGVGEPDFEPPEHVREAAKRAIDAGCSKYTAVTGIPALKEAICDATERMRGWRPKTENVCVSVGAKHTLFNLALSLYEPGDEVVIPKPYWVSYPEQVRLVGATPVLVDTREEDGWRLSPEQLERSLGPRTKAVVLCTPSNPTGTAYTEGETRALVDVLRKHDCWLIVDEIYAELVYEGFRFVSAAKIAPDLRDRLIVVDGVSKTFAMTGWRIGWALAPAPLVKALDVVQGQSTTNPTAVAQHAAVAALKGPMEDFTKIRDAFEKRRNAMVAGLNSIPGVRCRKPEGAFYAFADCRGLYGVDWNGKSIATDEDVAFWLLDKAHVAAVPGSGFGAPGYVRFSYAASEERIAAGIAAMRAAAEEGRRKR